MTLATRPAAARRASGGNGHASRALRDEITELVTIARRRLVADGYAGRELDSLVTHMVSAYLAGRDGFLPVASGTRR